MSRPTIALPARTSGDVVAVADVVGVGVTLAANAGTENIAERTTEHNEIANARRFVTRRI